MNIDLSPIVSNAVTLPTTQQGGAQLLNSVNKIVYAVALICFGLLVASLVAVYKLYHANKAKDEEIISLKASIKSTTESLEQTKKSQAIIAPQAKTELTEEEKAAAVLNTGKLLDQRKEAERLIMDLFGGQEKFEELPELDGKDKTDGFIYVELDELTAPIMRGRDASGRLFLSIRAKDSSVGMCCQTFFSRYRDCEEWISTGTAMISIPVITGGEKTTNYENLKNFVQMKKLEVESEYVDSGKITYEIC